MSDKKYKELFKDFMSRKRQQTNSEKTENIPPPVDTPPVPETPQPQEETAEEDDPRILYQFWKKWATSLYDVPPSPKKFSVFAFEKYLFGNLTKEDFSPANAKGSFGPFYEGLELTAKHLLLQWEKKEDFDLKQQTIADNPDTEETVSEEAAEKIQSIDAQIKVGTSNKNMAGYVFIFPPINGGAAITAQNILDVLTENGIVYGIDTSMVNQIAAQQTYLRFFSVAKGLAPKPGIDGKIVDRVSRTSVADYQENDQGIVDFKNLGLIHNITAGDIICDIIPPVPGEDGFDVLGHPIKASVGNEADVPAGPNTEINSDGTSLVASIDGCISYEKGQFRVENKLVLPGNVDNSTGNINFLGDVIVKGDVLNGFEIRASGNVQVGGMAEGASIYAGGNITIGKGMNGDKRGILEAQGDIICKFLENCTAKAGGNVHSDSIVWSDVFSDNSVYAQRGKGVIIGGTITARNTVEAKIIGNKSNQKTQITLGHSPALLNEKKALEDDLKTIENTLDMIHKNIRFLEKKASTLSPEKKSVLEQLRAQRTLYEDKQLETVEKMTQIDLEMSDFSQCRVLSDMVFPVTAVTIGYDSRNIENFSLKCNIRMSEGEIIIGTKAT